MSGGGLGAEAVERIVRRIVPDIVRRILAERFVEFVVGIVEAVISAVVSVLNAITGAIAGAVLPVAGAIVDAGEWFAGQIVALQESIANVLIQTGLAAPFAVAAAWAAALVVMIALVWFVFGVLRSVPIVGTAIAVVTKAIDSGSMVVQTTAGSVFGDGEGDE